jgi:hypothetical protein
MAEEVTPNEGNVVKPVEEDATAKTIQKLFGLNMILSEIKAAFSSTDFLQSISTTIQTATSAGIRDVLSEIGTTVKASVSEALDGKVDTIADKVGQAVNDSVSDSFTDLNETVVAPLKSEIKTAIGPGVVSGVREIVNDSDLFGLIISTISDSVVKKVSNDTGVRGAFTDAVKDGLMNATADAQLQKNLSGIMTMTINTQGFTNMMNTVAENIASRLSTVFQSKEIREVFVNAFKEGFSENANGFQEIINTSISEGIVDLKAVKLKGTFSVE